MDDIRRNIIMKLGDQLNAMQDVAASIYKAESQDPSIVMDALDAQGYDSLDALYINIGNLKLMIAKLKSKWE